MKQKGLLILAVVLLVFAAALVMKQTLLNPENKQSTGLNVEQQIARIEKNDRMPPQAKAAAIAQIKMRAATSPGPTDKK